MSYSRRLGSRVVPQRLHRRILLNRRLLGHHRQAMIDRFGVSLNINHKAYSDNVAGTFPFRPLTCLTYRMVIYDPAAENIHRADKHHQKNVFFLHLFEERGLATCIS